MRRDLPETSLETYRMIQANGLLSKRRMQVYDVIYENGSISTNEVIVLCQKRHGVTLNTSSFSARFTELNRQGVIVCVGIRKCPHNKNTSVQIWHTTNNLPSKLKLHKSRMLLLEEEVKKLREENKRLKE